MSSFNFSWNLFLTFLNSIFFTIRSNSFSKFFISSTGGVHSYSNQVLLEISLRIFETIYQVHVRFYQAWQHSALNLHSDGRYKCILSVPAAAAAAMHHLRCKWKKTYLEKVLVTSSDIELYFPFICGCIPSITAWEPWCIFWGRFFYLRQDDLGVWMPIQHNYKWKWKKFLVEVSK